MPLAACYCRVSTEDQGRGYSLTTQQAACLALAAERGYSVPESHILYDDVSGAILDRPGLRHLRTLVQTRAIDAVVIHDMDRLSRKLAHQLLLDEEFGQAGVQLHVVTMPNTDKSPEGQLLTHVKGVIAEYERTKLAERTARGRLGRAKAGHVWGGSPALGYIAIRAPHQARWEVDAEEAALVRRIFQLCIAGKSTRAIAWQLSQEGILTCLDRRARTAGKKELPRGAWQPASVHRILAYEPYCTGLA
jgi:site-specific DNA recombinase